MARPECPGSGEESLCAYIERANACRPWSKTKKIVCCMGLVFVVAMCMLFLPTDIHCLFVIVVAVLVPFVFLLCEVVYFQKTNEFSYGLGHVAGGDWWYMEMYFRERKSYFFGRIMRSPAFILIAGYYYQLKVGDEPTAAKLLELARGLDPELKTVEMTPNRRLIGRERELLMEGLRRDLGVTWIYKLKQKKMLWATGGLLLFLLFVIRYVIILVDSGRLMLKGLAE